MQTVSLTSIHTAAREQADALQDRIRELKNKRSAYETEREQLRARDRHLVEKTSSLLDAELACREALKIALATLHAAERAQAES